MTISGKQPRIRFALFSYPAVVLAVVLVALSSATASAQIFSPYKDVTINANWNTGQQQSAVTGTVEAVTSAMPSGDSTLTWAFATGNCGLESWAGITPAMEATNVQGFVNAGKSYIVSTGGADGVFDCPSNSGMQTFINTYYSNNMKGVDYDIEGGQSQAIVNDLINATKYAEGVYPNMRFSFTVATLGAASNSSDLNAYGAMVMSGISSLGLGGNYFVDLMAFDYGSVSSSNCVVSGSSCDMAQSAIAAAESLHAAYGTPYSHIELCLMIGQADSGASETLSLANVDTIVSWGKSVGLGGYHFWSFDRDDPSASSSSTGDGTSNAALSYTNRFASDVGGGGGSPPPPPPTEGPYPGPSPAAIPGTVMAENYDTGGQGLGYSVSSTNGSDNAYRSDGVDLETATSPATGNDLGWTASGQWFRYTVNVATAGTYTVSILVASPSAVGDAFHISNSSGTNLSGSVAVPATGGYQTWTTVTANVTLPAGTQTLTVNQDAAGWNIDSLKFASSGGGSCTTKPNAPTGLAASGTTSSSTNLNWTADTAPANCSISSYTVLRNGTSIGTASGTSFGVTGLAASTNYSFTVEATDAAGTSAASSAVSVTTLASSGGEGPYPGPSAAAVPGTVMAENYDTGGQGVAYNVTSTNGTDNGYRSQGVDLETASSPATGNDLGWTASGQWFRYTVNVSTAATYKVSFLVASPSAVGDAFHISNSSGTNLSGSVAVPATGGYQTWVTVTANVTLPAGTQTLTVNQDAGGWNIDSMIFASSGGGGGGGSVSLSPSSYNFGSVAHGSGTAWVTFTLTNGGSSAVSISNVGVSGPFVVSSNCGSSVAANGSCPIYVYFEPASAGSFTGTLTVTDGSGTQTSALSGTGT
jgi:hypothetical protein